MRGSRLALSFAALTVALLPAACVHDDSSGGSAVTVPSSPCAVRLGGGMRSVAPPLRYDSAYSMANNVVAGTSDQDMWWFLNDGSWHWDGHCWHDLGTPGVHRPQSAVVFGPADAWVADGENLAHWDGRSWNARMPAPTAGFVTLTGTGDDDLWALTSSGDDRESFLTGATELRHFDGRAWTALGSNSDLGFGRLDSVAAVVPHQVWLAGSTPDPSTPPVTRDTPLGQAAEPGPTSRPLVRRGDGRHWQTVPLPGDADFVLTQLVAHSDRDVWLAGKPHGSAGTGTETHAVLERWDGSAWQRIPEPPDPGAASAGWTIAPDGAGGLWMAWHHLHHWDGSRRRWTTDLAFPTGPPKRWVRHNREFTTGNDRDGGRDVGHAGGPDGFEFDVYSVAPVSGGAAWVALSYRFTGMSDEDLTTDVTWPHYATLTRAR